MKEKLMWKAIDSAPKDETLIILACFHKDEVEPRYITLAKWITASPGYIHCASYSGWEVWGPPLVEPPKSWHYWNISNGIISPLESPPTHWMEIPEKTI